MKKVLAKVIEKSKSQVKRDEAQEEKKSVSMVRCPDCPLKAGLQDDDHLCPTCEGTGQVKE